MGKDKGYLHSMDKGMRKICFSAFNKKFYSKLPKYYKYYKHLKMVGNYIDSNIMTKTSIMKSIV